VKNIEKPLDIYTKKSTTGTKLMSTILGKWSYPYKASNDRKKKQSCLIWRANQIHGSLVSRQQIMGFHPPFQNPKVS